MIKSKMKWVVVTIVIATLTANACDKPKKVCYTKIVHGKKVRVCTEIKGCESKPKLPSNDVEDPLKGF